MFSFLWLLGFDDIFIKFIIIKFIWFESTWDKIEIHCCSQNEKDFYNLYSVILFIFYNFWYKIKLS